MTLRYRDNKAIVVPAGGTGLSQIFDVAGLWVDAISIPGDWAAANITFRGSPYRPDLQPHVYPDGVTAGLSPDANAQDIEMDNAVTLDYYGSRYTPAKVDPIDISALISAAATISTSSYGTLWVWQKKTGSSESGVVAVEVDKTTADYASLIASLAQYSKPTRTFPSTQDYVPIGAVNVQEGGSGAFTWGTDSIAAEGETYYNFTGVPEVLVRATSLALDAGAATYTYGAVTVRLGTGTRIAASGKANVAITGSNVADGAVGAWILYVLADDVEYALQLGNAYPTLADAQAAVANHVKNPLLPFFGVMYVQNASGGAFVPGTTNLDAAGVTTTFDIEDSTLQNIHDDTNAELTVTTGGNDRLIQLSTDAKENLRGVHTLQLRSGTSATPVDQTTSPTLTVVLSLA